MVYVIPFMSNPHVFCKVQHKNSLLIKRHYCSDVSVLQNNPQSINLPFKQSLSVLIALQPCFLPVKAGKENVLTFEQKAVRLWVSVIPPKHT